ncbi:MAG: hypothetical protein ACREIA_03180, partial [Opitutaceae bacterium]
AGAVTSGNVDPDRRARIREMMANNPEMAARFRERGGHGDAGRGVSSRVVYKLVGPPEAQKLEAVRVRTGISDSSFTEVLAGLQEGDTIVTSVILPGKPASNAAPMRAFGAGNSGGSGGGPRFRGF